MKLTRFILLFSIIAISYSQQYSKERALYTAKSFVMSEVLGVEHNVIKFEMDPLVAASSGELTTAFYNCEQKKLRGLVLGFWGTIVDESGTYYNKFAFKNLTEQNAVDLFSEIEKNLSEHSKYLKDFEERTNIYFQYDDIVFLIDRRGGWTTIRVFWNGFDSAWNNSAYKKTKKLFEELVNK